MKAANGSVADIAEKSSSVPTQLERKCSRIRRLEFLKEIWIDTTRDIPSYYVIDRDDDRVKARIGVSFELTRNRRISDSTVGKLFYPIALNDGMTGNHFSINAPFTLDTLRFGLAPQDELNNLLLKEAASFTAYLYRNVLTSRFGASSYLLLKQTSVSNAEIFLEKLYNEIRSQRCVLNNKYVKGSKIDCESMFCEDDLYLPCKIVERNGVMHYYPAKGLYGFVSDKRCVTCEIEDIELRGLLVSKIGAKPFTIHDVVSLKVNDYVLRSEGQFKGWHFTTKEAFDAEMLKQKMQRRYANAINNHFKELDGEEKSYLKTSYSWLSEAGRLRPLTGKDQLFRWKGKIPEFPGFDIDDLIHHCISRHPLIEKLHVASYDMNKSLLSATIPKLERGELDKDKRIKLLNFVVDNASKLSDQVIKALKKHQIFLDNKGRLVEFDRLIKASKLEAEIFGDVISIPCEKILDSKIFLRRFHIRDQVNDEDIIKKVERLRQAPDTIDKNDLLSFEAYLNKRKISSHIADYLKDTLLVVCNGNTIASPQSDIIYYDTKRMRSVIGDGVLYAKGSFKKIFKKLGIRFQPRSDDVHSFIAKLRETGTPPPERSLLYTELAKALVRDGKSLGCLQDDKIVYLEGRYHRPKDVFLNTAYRGVLLDSKVYLKAKGKLNQSLIELGCKLEPVDEDYIDFLRWVSIRLMENLHENLREKYVSLIHHAYSKLSSLETISLEDNVILTHNGQMVSRKEVGMGQVFVDDDPQLSRQIESAGIRVWFANCGPKGYNFMESLGVPKLSQSVSLIEKNVKAPQIAIEEADALLLKLKSSEVINAISSIVQQNDEWRTDMQNEDWAGSIEGLQIKSAESIQKTFNIGNNRFSMDAKSCVHEGTVYLLDSLKLSEMRDLLAIEVSQIILKTKHNQSSLGDAIYRILEGDIYHYLSSRGYVYERRMKKPEQIDIPKPPLRTVPPPEHEAIKPETKLETKQEPEWSSDEEEEEIRIEVLNPIEVETSPASGWRGGGPRLAQRFRTADIANYWIIRMEKEDDPGCSAFDRSDDDLGYDVEVRKEDAITKMIEVKSFSGPTFPAEIEMTPNEWRQAKSEKNRYWLYVVCDVLKDNREMKVEGIRSRVKKFRDPFAIFKDTATFERKRVTKSEKRVIIKLGASSSQPRNCDILI